MDVSLLCPSECTDWSEVCRVWWAQSNTVVRAAVCCHHGSHRFPSPQPVAARRVGGRCGRGLVGIDPAPVHSGAWQRRNQGQSPPLPVVTGRAFDCRSRRYSGACQPVRRGAAGFSAQRASLFCAWGRHCPAERCLPRGAQWSVPPVRDNEGRSGLSGAR